MRRNLICMVFVILLFVLFGDFIYSNFNFNKPSLIIGIDEDRASEKNYIYYDFFMVRNALIGPDNLIYALDFKANTIYKFDLKGNFVGKYARTGQGPGELNKATEFDFVGEELWVANARNGRIEVFDKTGKDSSFRIEGMELPFSVASSGFFTIVMGGSFGNINIMDKNKKVVGEMKVENPMKFKRHKSLWSNGVAKNLHKSLFLGIFNYVPLVCTFDVKTREHKVYDLSEYYSIYEANNISKSKGLPYGLAAINGCAGPDNTIFIVACDKKERCCGRLMQFSADFKKKLKETKLGFCVRDIRYYPKRKIMLFVTGEEEVRLFKDM